MNPAGGCSSPIVTGAPLSSVRWSPKWNPAAESGRVPLGDVKTVERNGADLAHPGREELAVALGGYLQAEVLALPDRAPSNGSNVAAGRLRAAQLDRAPRNGPGGPAWWHLARLAASALPTVASLPMNSERYAPGRSGNLGRRP